MKRYQFVCPALAIGFSAISTALPAAAQSGLEVIVVTPQRREANLQSTPVTVSAFSETQLQDLAIVETKDLGQAVPNLQLLPLTASPSTFQVGFRGGVEQTGGLIVSEPVVGIYVDDVYRSRLQGANFQVADIERIEVLRGPQGTLYGRNNFSGALKLITKTPSANNEWLNAAVGIGSFSETNVQVSIGRGLTENLGVSFSALYRDQADGYIFNRAQNRNIGAEENVLIRGKLNYEKDAFQAILSFSYGDDQNDGYIPLAIRYEPPTVPSNFANRVTTDQVRPRFGDDAFVTEFPQESLGATEVTSITLDLSYELEWATLRSITGYVDVNDEFRWDIAAGVSDGMGGFTPSFDRDSDASADQITQELQAQGSALGDRLDWIVGAFFFSENGDQELDDNIPLFFLGDLEPTFLDIDSTSWAVFAQGTFALTDRLSAFAGVRYTEDDKGFDASISTATPFNPTGPRVAVSLDEKFTAVTPTFGLEFQVTDNIYTYANITRGFKAGGFNGLAVANPTVLQAVFDPQFVWAYEAGAKTDWLDNRLRANIAMFYNDISGSQQTANIGPGSFATQNVGDLSIFGIELELAAQPVDWLNVFANVGYMDGDYGTLNPASQAFQAGAQFLPLVTEWSGQAGFNVNKPIADFGILKLGGTANYVGDHFLETTNSIQVEGYTRFDGFVGFSDPEDRFEVRLEGRNLSDEVNYVTGFANSPNPALAALKPRTWMLRVSFRG
ncbi:MAG: TonB-dependent receptor [Pseudomonadota bacterium]